MWPALFLYLHEILLWIQVILPGFVNDSDHASLTGLLIRNRLVNPPGFKRGGILSIVDAEGVLVFAVVHIKNLAAPGSQMLGPLVVGCQKARDFHLPNYPILHAAFFSSSFFCLTSCSTS